MDILEDIISSITDTHPVKEVYTCTFWTAVISKHCGLSSTFKESHPNHETVRDAGKLRQKDILELIQYARSDILLEASIGMAAINSVIDTDESLCIMENAFDAIVRRGTGKNIAVVGHFPWIPKLRNIAKQLWVIEQRLQPGDLPEEAANDVIPDADVVAITGTSFINHTINNLLKLSKGKYIVVLGPTTPLSPILFDHGVDVISGSQVIDSQKLIFSITEGATLKQVDGIKFLNMSKEFKK